MCFFRERAAIGTKNLSHETSKLEIKSRPCGQLSDKIQRFVGQ